MNKVPVLIPAAIAAILATGCATTAQPVDASGATSRHEAPRYEVNGEYVSAVERQARRRGVQVMWLNKPTRPSG